VRTGINDHELLMEYRRARVVLLALEAATANNSLLEAMACGTPAVVSDVSSLPEVVGDAGLRIDPKDTDALADAILRLIQDASLRKTLREAGIAQARKFTWDKAARELLAVYNRFAPQKL